MVGDRTGLISLALVEVMGHLQVLVDSTSCRNPRLRNSDLLEEGESTVYVTNEVLEVPLNSHFHGL